MIGEAHCDHCHLPADVCNCGVDRELVWRDSYRQQTSSSSKGWIVLVGGLAALMALRVVIFGWS